MKKFVLLTSYLLILLLSFNGAQAQGEGKVSHVVLVWLKQPGNAEMRKQFIENSKKLNKLPGVINRHVGVVKPSKRAIVDDTFDVAVTVTLKNQATLDAYMKAPLHKKIVAEKLKPLINRVVVYDFVSE